MDNAILFARAKVCTTLEEADYADADGCVAEYLLVQALRNYAVVCTLAHVDNIVGVAEYVTKSFLAHST